MAKYKVLFLGEMEDEVFDTEEDAQEYASHLSGCTKLGAEILHMSNPGDYPEDDSDPEYEIIEIDEDDE